MFSAGADAPSAASGKGRPSELAKAAHSLAGAANVLLLAPNDKRRRSDFDEASAAAGGGLCLWRDF